MAKIRHIALTTDNPRQVAEFYKSAFDLEEIRESDNGAVFLSDGYINLAILNILPIPMLDGGRLLFVGIEWVRRGKRIPPEKESLVHLIGFVVLIGLILWISAIDVGRLVQGGSPLGG